MPGCVVAWCGKNSSKRDNNDERIGRKVTFHNLPNEPKIREKWIQEIRNGGRPDSWEPTTNAKICSLHFDVEDLAYNGRLTNIRRGAVPKIRYSAVKKKPRCNNRQIRPDLLQTVVLDLGISEDSENIQDDYTLPTQIDSTQMYEVASVPENSTINVQQFVELMQVTPASPIAEKPSKKVVKLPEDHTFECNLFSTLSTRLQFNSFRNFKAVSEEADLEKLNAKVMSALEELFQAAKNNSKTVAAGVESMMNKATELMTTIKIDAIAKDLRSYENYATCKVISPPNFENRFEARQEEFNNTEVFSIINEALGLV